ncbi:MAG: transporter substrate-binding domain-containing protein [Colwellia sp.]|nr:transporter substrate-binding domain-containing protein [Colwellia sp.]
MLIYSLKILLILTLFFFNTITFAENNTQIGERSKLEIIAGLSKPPFIIEDNNSGIELDIFQAAFGQLNKEVTFIHVPFGRTITSFHRLNVDGIITVLPDYQHPNVFVSAPYITYQNVAVSLRENEFIIDDIKSLSRKSMVAFQNARKYLGDAYVNSINSSLEYREIADQMKQIDMLFLHRTEVIILDINIFRHFMKSHSSGRFSQPYNVHYIFNKRPYSAAFNVEKNRDLFDEGIKIIKQQGTYQLIMDKYLK